MDRGRNVRAPAWQGCQMREVKQALVERRRRIREATTANAAAAPADAGPGNPV